MMRWNEWIDPAGAGVRSTGPLVTHTPQGREGPRDPADEAFQALSPGSLHPLSPCPPPRRKPTLVRPWAWRPGASETNCHLPTWPQGMAAEDPKALVTITVQCAFTLALKAPRGADVSSLRALLSRALPHQAQQGQLRWAGKPPLLPLSRAGRGAL